jgi:hypothetical protein
LRDTLAGMPRYGTRTLLIVFGIIALWLATFAGHGAAQDFRRSMLLLALVAAACLAIFSHGRRRAFWTGFAVVMFLCGGISMNRPLHRYVPDFVWQNNLGVNMVVSPAPAVMYPPPMLAPTPADPGSQPPQVITYSPSPYSSGMPGTYGGPYSGLAFRQPTVWLGLIDTMTAGWTLALSALGGFVAAYIYSRTRPAISEASLSARQIVEQELHDLRGELGLVLLRRQLR